MKQSDRYKAVIERFGREMPTAGTELHYGNPYELLVAVILSAQCTDKRVNLITPPFFKVFPTPEALAGGDAGTDFRANQVVLVPQQQNTLAHGYGT